jgi:hypothetical protein
MDTHNKLEVGALRSAWERYRGVAEAAAANGVSDEKRGKVKALIAKHAHAITSLRDERDRVSRGEEDRDG